MKLLRPDARPRPENPDKKTIRVSEPPLKICVVFDEDASANSAEILIRHVASDCRCDTQSFCFGHLNASALGVAAARNAADADILMLAGCGDWMLSSHIRLWLGLCLGLRAGGRDGAFVALITKTARNAELDSSLVDYLEAVAGIGGLAFFLRQQSLPADIAEVPVDLAPWLPRRSGLSASSRARSPADRCFNCKNTRGRAFMDRRLY